MSLAPRARLGPYEITAKLGEGGMGEVYRATDSRLKREVAIKVLPSAFTTDRERLARFEREAQLLAQFQHPNIAAVHGLEQADDGTRALVMELVEGEDLAQRIARGPIPVEEAIAIAQQIAEGLEAAHEHGIVHRDLKPSNVKVRPDGTVKVLDFGLAKMEVAPVAGPATSPTLMTSPTLTGAGTQLGAILGSAAYMSPEQARGGLVDKRADIWAFGVVLFEMLTGRRLFAGDTTSDTLAGVLRDEVDLSSLPAATPPSIRRLLARCLDRNPRSRLRDIGEARVALGASADASEPIAASVVAPVRGRRWREGLAWALVVLLGVLGAWALWRRPAISETSDVSYVELSLPSGVQPIGGSNYGFEISPDGRSVSMVGAREGVRRLYVQRLDRPQAIEVADSVGVSSTAFSPDGASVALVRTGGGASRVSLVDQRATPVTPYSDQVSSIAWGDSGIVFCREGALWIAPGGNREARQLTRLDESRHEIIHVEPMQLPGSGVILFSSLTSDAGGERIEAVEDDGSGRRVVIDRASGPVWSPTGHLLFARDGMVWATPLDPRRAVPLGDPVAVMPAGFVATTRWGSLAFRVSASGTLMFLPSDFDAKRAVFVDRSGGEQVVGMPTAPYASPRLSPDGRRLVVVISNSVLETFDLARGTRVELSSGAGTLNPAWTSDGRRVVSRRTNRLSWDATDGTERSGELLSGGNDNPSAAGPDPDSMLITRIMPATGSDVFLLSLSGKVAARPLIQSPAFDGGPQLSPDHRWLAYQSNPSGKAEIYVRRFPQLDRAWQVSEDGGVQLRWSANGREIYYRTGERMMAVAFDGSGSEPILGKPLSLFDDDYDVGQQISIANYDVAPDGRFVMLRRTPYGGRVHLVLHWDEELKRILAAGGVRQ